MEVSAYLSKLGKRGGKRRAQKLTPEQRSEIARKAAAASAKVRRQKARERKRAERAAKGG